MNKLKIAFDIDDTLYKIDADSEGKLLQIPDYKLVTVLQWFLDNGHDVYAWSAGGVDYAKAIINKLGLGRSVTVIPKKGWEQGDGPEMDIAFDDMEVGLAKVNVKVKRPAADECRICEKKWVPDLDALGFTTGKWDRHTYKPGCEHMPANMRMSIG